MPKNKVQFQKGLSLSDFLGKYGTGTQCREALVKLRRPDGFVCPKCGNEGHCKLSTRNLYQCNRCHHQTSITAGTIFHRTRLPLTKWFLAICLLTRRKKSIPALQLSREIGVNHDTAWKIKHKLLQVMLERQRKEKLSGRIELDDAYLGGERPGKRGRGSENKIPFLAAVETRDEKPVRMQLRRVRGFRKSEIARCVRESVAGGSEVVSDGLGCFTGVVDAGCRHTPVITGGGRKSVKLKCFKRVDTMLGNLKNSLRGTCHSIHKKHTPGDLAEFECRCNRRYRLETMIERLAWVAVRTPPMPCKLLTLAEPYG